LKASDGLFQDAFGLSVAVTGATVVVGSKYSHASYVFVRPNGWTGPLPLTEDAKLVKSDGSPFSWATVAINPGADSIVVASYLEGVYIYLRPVLWNGTLTESAVLTPSAGTVGFAGGGVAVDGGSILVGAPSDLIGGIQKGSVLSFRWVGAQLHLPLIIR
jgi:hypothetical protein